jgi:hypothetical protein
LYTSTQRAHRAFSTQRYVQQKADDSKPTQTHTKGTTPNDAPKLDKSTATTSSGVESSGYDTNAPPLSERALAIMKTIPQKTWTIMKAIPPKTWQFIINFPEWSRTLPGKIKKELHHYWVGTKLLYTEIKTTIKIVWRLLHGGKLSRRERRQLVRTTTDLLRVIPFLVIVIVPFMEFSLPVLLKLFPNMLPSTFEDKLKKVSTICCTTAYSFDVCRKKI